LGIDVSKNTLDVSISSCTKVRTKSFANTSDGWHHLLDWLVGQKIRRVHACLESTGRYSLGIACALYEAGHIVSIINPAQVRDFVRTKLGRNKTDGIDASRIREYCELFKLAFFTALPPCLVGMEACTTSHYWARELAKLGHQRCG
jgi:transposase